jgi:hypothetical protein
MLAPQNKLGTLLGDHYGRRIGIAAGNSWHNGSINNTQIFNSVHS